MRASATIFIVGASVLPVTVIEAHHSFATHYDASRSTQLSGVVAKFDFRSPHSFIFVDVENDDGGVTQYEVELHSVPVLTRMGFSPDIFKPGDRITVNAWPNRSPTNPLVFGIGVITADGVALGEFPPIPTVQSAYRSASGALRVQGRWRAPRPAEPTSFDRPMSLTPAGERAVREYDPAKSPANACEPYNVPAVFLTPYQFDIRLTDREAIIFHEAYGITRRVPLGPAAARVEPTGVFGTARARIEGNELVIESSGYPPSGWGLATAVDENGLGADIPSSGQKAVVERFSVSDDGLTLTLRYTVGDPIYLTEQRFDCARSRRRRVADLRFRVRGRQCGTLLTRPMSNPTVSGSDVTARKPREIERYPRAARENPSADCARWLATGELPRQN